jgi:hypothetical protein
MTLQRMNKEEKGNNGANYNQIVLTPERVAVEGILTECLRDIYVILRHKNVDKGHQMYSGISTSEPYLLIRTM